MGESLVNFIITYGIYLFVIGLNVGLSFIAANMARRKGYSFGGFWLIGFFASFVFALILAWVLPDLYLFMTKEEYQHGQAFAQQVDRKCANCGKPLRNDEVFCSLCGTKASDSGVKELWMTKKIYGTNE